MNVISVSPKGEIYSTVDNEYSEIHVFDPELSHYVLFEDLHIYTSVTCLKYHFH